MVGPSASGSLNGTPSSMTSAPASASARTNFSVASNDGSPAVMYATMPSSPDSRSSAKRLELRVELEAATVIIFRQERLEQPRVSVHVLVAAAGQVEDEQAVLAHSGDALDEAGDGVCRFQRRDDAFGAR